MAIDQDAGPRGEAPCGGRNEVSVGGETYTADHILVAVGGKPTFPDMEGAAHCISSDGFFSPLAYVLLACCLCSSE